MNRQTHVSLADIQRMLNSSEVKAWPKLRITVLRNVMVEPLEPYLRYSALQSGFNAEVRFGGYDMIVQEAAGASPDLLNPETDAVLIFMRLEGLSWKLARQFSSLDAPARESELDRIERHVAAVMTGIRRQTNALVLFCAFEQPPYPAFGASDAQMPDGQTATIARLNRMVQDCLGRHKHAYLLDVNACVARIGSAAFYDRRYWHIGRAPYSREALRELGAEAWKFVRAAKGKQKKCLVLDCDNTLWGGLVGEDGVAGIKLGGGYPGSAYQEFQHEIVNLYHRGVILALCSKNNEEDVWEVFRQHPDMVLKEAHIASAKINWDDKASNLRLIAHELNIGLDSLVFLDDSEVEIELVRRILPEVEAIHLPRDRVTDYRDMLASIGLFDSLTISEEDRQRGAMYKAEVARKKLHEQAPDLESFLASLDMVAEVRPADAMSIPRIAQLTQKTNQFNLTTRRYADSDIAALAGRADSEVFSLRLKDKFGDSGIVGVAVLKYNRQSAWIDTFLLSCRVLGRSVEDWFVRYLLRYARDRGVSEVFGEYVPTGKNGQAEHFYEKQGFAAMGRSEADGSRLFRFDVTGPIPPAPTHIRMDVGS
jgi:FkbH-like protein